MFPIRDNVPARRPPVATLVIIGVNTLVFLFELTLNQAQMQGLFYHYGLVPARLTNPLWAAQTGLGFSLLPFLTTQFLHGGWFHLLGNMWMLWIFGDNVEDRLGSGRFIVFYLTCGGAAGLLHFLTNWSSTVPAVGASGAIAGVLGAYFLLHPGARVLTLIPVFFYPLFVEIPAAVFLGLWFLMQLFSGAVALLGPGGGIAWWAHIGGFLAGMLWVRRGERRPPPYTHVHFPQGPSGPPVIDIEPSRRDPRREPW
ncbi:MAG: rhomboid family intramembrane serine protease [Acidobacteria bacterium]|nr:rhomboid family intramembrane serine protease [Acidobacteriota bacterium]